MGGIQNTMSIPIYRVLPYPVIQYVSARKPSLAIHTQLTIYVVNCVCTAEEGFRAVNCVCTAKEGFRAETYCIYIIIVLFML